MSTITSLVGTDGITTANSMAKINTNFSNLNTDKIETSVIDTDTSLAANSDSKIASQKAAKTYTDTVAGQLASTTAKGNVEEATLAELNAGTATGATGARLFVNPSIIIGSNIITKLNGGATNYDLSTASGVQNIAHGLTIAPRYIDITGMYNSSPSAGASITKSFARSIYINSTQSSISDSFTTGDGAAGSTGEQVGSFRIRTAFGGSTYQEGVITTDATNIIITWTKTGSPTGNVSLFWTAFA